MSYTCKNIPGVMAIANFSIIWRKPPLFCGLIKSVHGSILSDSTNPALLPST